MSTEDRKNNRWKRNRIRKRQKKRNRDRVGHPQDSHDGAAGCEENQTPAIEGGAGGLPETALFERPRLAREDVRLARMAIRKRWEPVAEQTHAVLNKATEVALADTAHPQTVIAVAKLHLDAHRQVQADEHHDDRLEYHERALQIRSKVGDYIPPSGTQIGINVATGGNLHITIPHNFRDEGMVDELTTDPAV